MTILSQRIHKNLAKHTNYFNFLFKWNKIYELYVEQMLNNMLIFF